eukprot:2529818-Rhodomonas_salina.1
MSGIRVHRYDHARIWRMQPAARGGSARRKTPKTPSRSHSPTHIRRLSTAYPVHTPHQCRVSVAYAASVPSIAHCARGQIADVWFVPYVSTALHSIAASCAMSGPGCYSTSYAMSVPGSA